MSGPRSKTMMDAVLRRTPVQPVFHWRAARSLAVLAYHEIRDRERFAWQLDHLRRATSPVSVRDVIRAAEGGIGLPQRAVLVTFDDGHRDVLEVAMPMLRERGMPAVAFVVSGLVGTEAPHWWTEVKDLVATGGRSSAVAGLRPEDAVRALKRVRNDVRLEALADLRRTAPRPARSVRQLTEDDLDRLESDGVAIGSHSLTHPCLTRCSSETIREEVDEAHEILAASLGHEIDAFAYPDGDRDERVSAIVRSSSHRAGFLFDHRLSPPRPPDPLNISRLRVDADASSDRFRIIVSGLHPSIHRIRGLR
jgi:peptidoglycan/xylan/chitin deacetylase (PgdA/CDA1 family)